jgi:hypothetical protein
MSPFFFEMRNALCREKCYLESGCPTPDLWLHVVGCCGLRQKCVAFGFEICVWAPVNSIVEHHRGRGHFDGVLVFVQSGTAQLTRSLGNGAGVGVGRGYDLQQMLSPLHFETAPHICTKFSGKLDKFRKHCPHARACTVFLATRK